MKGGWGMGRGRPGIEKLHWVLVARPPLSRVTALPSPWGWI